MADKRIELAGEYDLSRRDELSSLFASLDGDDPIVIDMTKVSYIDSTILHELTALRSNYRERKITLAGTTANVRRLFELVSFDRLFDIS